MNTSALDLSGLSKREAEVAKLLIMGVTSKYIADKLFVTEKCIKFHITNIFQKTRCKQRGEFIARWWMNTPEHWKAVIKESSSKTAEPYT